MNKRGALIGGGVAVLVAIVAAAVWFGISSSDDESARPGIKKGDPAAEAADAFAAAWTGGTLSKVAFVDTNGDVNGRSLVIAAGLGSGVAGKPVKAEITSMRTVPPKEGVEGEPALVDCAMEEIRVEIERRGIDWRWRE